MLFFFRYIKMVVVLDCITIIAQNRDDSSIVVISFNAMAMMGGCDYASTKLCASLGHTLPGRCSRIKAQDRKTACYEAKVAPFCNTSVVQSTAWSMTYQRYSNHKIPSPATREKDTYVCLMQVGRCISWRLERTCRFTGILLHKVGLEHLANLEIWSAL